MWEINGELVSSNQPSGRIITLPNSVVLSSHVKNYTREEFPYVWNELTIQVAYETDLEYARGTMADVADDYIGDQMASRIAEYRERLAERRWNSRFKTARRSTSSRRSPGSNSACGTWSTRDAASAFGTSSTSVSSLRSTTNLTG